MLSRRAFLRRSAAAAAALPLAALIPGGAAAAPPAPLPIRPRADWAQGRAPTGPLESERPGDVRFLLVHHTASSNAYAPGDVPELLREFYALHTGPTRGWADIAYNFLVDRYGSVWEGRTGSLAGPVKGDSTGGSQGFALLCCFIGDHTSEPPTAESRTAMTALLAELASRYAIDPAPGRTATFLSRGSNRWPAGTTVTAPTIAAHRDMSETSCPGDAAYPLVRDVFPAQVAALLAAATTPSPAPARRATPSASVPSLPPPTRPSATTSPAAGSAPRASDDGGNEVTAATALLSAGVLALASVLGFRREARHRQPPLL